MRIKGLFVTAAVVAIAVHSMGGLKPTPSKAQIEGFSLVHAIGNAENVAAKGLPKYECESMKVSLKAAAGVLSGGSVTCIPDEFAAKP
ncbi:hypothetical protein [Mesorhizobium sp. NZP2298]|uniref:hypothetical protein n=1 Tax=Mesorhizobium sp. NZP2298 TaxID=2483403 RepID=UPI001553D457|nr:hypothetical protein [Mesorhizobium sp. NZP2298]QKC99175.1 hypothetical protein EB231_34870 [Mesorhizobium sp. NZP2298]